MERKPLANNIGNPQEDSVTNKNDSKVDEQVVEAIKDLKESIESYKKSEEYTKPKTETDQDFNSMVDAVDKLEEEEAEFLAERGEFGNAEERSEEVEEQLNIQLSDEKDDQSRFIKKSGILMIALGTLGTLSVLSVGGGIEAAYQRIKNPKRLSRLPPFVESKVSSIESIMKQADISDVDKFAHKARITSLAAAGLPIAFLIMGSVLVGDDKPSEPVLQASQVLLYAAGGLGAAAGVSLAALAANPTWTKKALAAVSRTGVDIATKLDSPSGVRKSTTQRIPADISFDEKIIPQLRKFSITLGIIPAIFGALVLYTGSELNLASVQNSPKVKLLTSIEIFYERMRKVEASFKPSR